VRALDVKDSVLQKPPVNVPLSAAAGAALIGRGHASGFCLSDGQVVEPVIRLPFWLRWAVQEANLRLKRLRRMLCGAPTPTSRDAPAASAAETAESPEAPSASLATPQAPRLAPPRGGHRSGPGRLGAEA
jgi:hypothetical protein